MQESRKRFFAWVLVFAGWAMAIPSALAQVSDNFGITGFGPGGGGFAQGTEDPLVTVTGQFTVPSDGTPAQLFVTAMIEPGWHIYSITQAPGGPRKTTISVDPSGEYRLEGDFVALTEPEVKAEAEFGGLLVESHYDSVTWQAPLKLAPGLDPSTVEIRGRVNAQPCDAGSCLPSTNFAFVARLGPGVSFPAETGGLAGEPNQGVAAFDPSRVEPEETVQATSLLQALIFALGGGLILNIMPCVLPVIGLKILAFFQQAGQSRRQAFMLNVWYSLGILSVFLVLAMMGVALSRMFTEELFGIAMASVVFAMALSLMGVWELQVPSFLGSGKTQELAGKEGAVGAVFKGVITTLLAIPCGAPLLSPALKWTDEQVRAGAPGNVYLIFCVIGLGMASPYLVIGAFPELLRWLPKPGPWMDTFRKAMGYFLLVAVVWILYFLPLEDMVPTVGLLFGLWIGCWLIGRPALTAPLAVKAKAWLTAVGIVILTAIVCFSWLLRPAMEHRLERLVAASVQEGKHDEAVYQRMFVLEAASLTGSPSSGGPDGPETPSNSQASLGGDDSSTLRWHPFSRAEFERLIAEQKTVLVDFTADWCLTCKTLERLVLNTAETREVVDANRVVALQADWTNGAPEVTEMLKILGGEQVPVVAIFPAGNPNRPIVLRGAFSKQSLRESLEKAGPSKSTL